MEKARLAAQSRAGLDERFKEFGAARRYAAPVRGWTKAVREALGMTTAQLANRLGVRQPSVVAIEQSEVKGTNELATLRRAAAPRTYTHKRARPSLHESFSRWYLPFRRHRRRNSHGPQTLRHTQPANRTRRDGPRGIRVAKNRISGSDKLLMAEFPSRL